MQHQHTTSQSSGRCTWLTITSENEVRSQFTGRSVGTLSHLPSSPETSATNIDNSWSHIGTEPGLRALTREGPEQVMTRVGFWNALYLYVKGRVLRIMP